jgi:hypothetical protein
MPDGGLNETLVFVNDPLFGNVTIWDILGPTTNDSSNVFYHNVYHYLNGSLIVETNVTEYTSTTG